MTKVKKPFLSFDARGKLGKWLRVVPGRGYHIVRTKSEVPDIKSLAQLSWRTMYQKAVALWHGLSPAEKVSWESAGTARHMTGFAWFMSQCLKPNPGLYLPLQGGTMTGDIDMAGHRIEDIPEPILDTDPATKLYADTHGMQAHEATHIKDGSDEIDSALNVAAIPNLAAGKITTGRFTRARLPAMTYEKYWVGTGATVEERNVPTPGEAPTKQIYSPVTYAGNVMGAKSWYPVAVLAASPQRANISLHIPHDFNSLTSAVIRVIPGATDGAAEWNISAVYAAVGEGYTTHFASDASITFNVTNNEIFDIDISGLLTNLAALDIIGVQIQMRSADPDVNVLGVIIRYS